MTDTITLLLQIIEKLKQLKGSKELEEITKQLNELIELLRQSQGTLSVICSLNILDKHITVLEKSCNYISEYVNNLSKILYADNSVGAEEQLKYIEVTMQSAKDIREILSLIHKIKLDFNNLNSILEKCGLSIHEIKSEITTKLSNLLYEINYFLQQAQYNIDQLEGFTNDLAEELFHSMFGARRIYKDNIDNLLEKYRIFAKYLVGYAVIIRYYTLISPTVGLKPNEVISLIKKLNEYIFDNFNSLFLDAIDNIDINKNLKNKIKEELNRISRKLRYSPLRNDNIKNLINEVSLDKGKELLENITEAFILGDRKYIESNRRLLSIFNDIEQVILNLIAIIILLDDIRNNLNDVCNYIRNILY
jgi:hypothetical protein